MFVPVTVSRQEDGLCETVMIQDVGTRQRYLAGTYRLEFGTTPPVRVDDVRVGDKHPIVPVTISEPGILNLNTGTSGYGGIFHRTESGLDLVVPSRMTLPDDGPPARSVYGDVPCKTRAPNRPLREPLCGYSPRRKPLS